jgi:DNA-binding transcriptional regulator YbjK
MSGLRERQKEQRRQVIAEAALELFKRNGFAATTLDQIAVQAGVSAPTVVNYFCARRGRIWTMTAIRWRRCASSKG